jgi:hypothetical protein
MFLYDPEEAETKPEVKLEPWRQHLLDAAQYIREHGWFQGGICDASQERVCLIGSLYASVGLLDAAAKRTPNLALRIDEEWCRVLGYLGLNPRKCDIADWNDATGRTQEEVIAALEGSARQ